jgi:hypothetical protein
MINPACYHVTDTGCWEWRGPRRATGYGCYTRRLCGVPFSPAVQLAHRWAWLTVYGPIPVGLFVCHRCDNPPCINPEHLFLGTAADNMRDAQEKRRIAWPRGERERCRNGHFPQWSTNSQGATVCEQCRRDSCRAHYQKLKRERPEVIAAKRQRARELKARFALEAAAG